MAVRAYLRKGLALIAAFLLLSGAVSARAETPENSFLSDYDEALRILGDCDPFISVIREENPRYDALCAEGRERVRSRCRSAAELAAILSDLFARLGNPGHLSVLDGEGYRQYALLAEQGVFGEGSPVYELLRDGKTRAVYAELESGKAAPADWSGRYVPYVTWDAERRLLYLRIPSFRHELMQRDRDVLVDAFRAHPDAAHIVFDICGNGGGSDYYWAELLVAPFGETEAYEKRVYFRDNELTRQYGYMEDAVPVSALDENELPDFVKALGLTHMLSGTITIEPAEESRTIRTDAKRWVLTDEYVFSAADGFAGFCRQSGWATLVGRPTLGDGGSEAPLLIRLPNTGLLMRFTAAASANAEGRLNTFFGTEPDIPSKPSERPFDTLLRIIDAGAGG